MLYHLFSKAKQMETEMVSPSIAPVTLLSPLSSSNQTQTVLSRKPFLTWMNLSVSVSASVSVQCSEDFTWMSRDCGEDSLHFGLSIVCGVGTSCSTADCTLGTAGVWTAGLFHWKLISGCKKTKTSIFQSSVETWTSLLSISLSALTNTDLTWPPLSFFKAGLWGVTLVALC